MSSPCSVCWPDPSRVVVQLCKEMHIIQSCKNRLKNASCQFLGWSSGLTTGPTLLGQVLEPLYKVMMQPAWARPACDNVSSILRVLLSTQARSSELSLIPGLRVTGGELVAAAAFPTLGAAGHMGQGVGTDEVPAEDTKEGPGTASQEAATPAPRQV